jgi:hypothetical protein
MASAGSDRITVINPSPGGGTSAPATFTVQAAPPPTYVRSIAGITDARDILSDRGLIYLTMPSTDPNYPNTLLPVDPVAGTIGKPIQTGRDPHLMSVSSDDAHLWVALDGDSTVERFSIPAFTQDFIMPVPGIATDTAFPQQAISIDAAPVSPHALALVAGNWQLSVPSDGTYVFDDNVQRPTFIPSWTTAGVPEIDWVQWGMDDTTIFGNEYSTIDQGGIYQLAVDASGVTYTQTNGGMNIQPYMPLMDRNNGILYSNLAAYDPATGAFLGGFDSPPGSGYFTCAPDTTTQRYYCATGYFDGPSDVLLWDLWVYDLNTYKFIERSNYGWSSSESGGGTASFTGIPQKIVRFGNAGLALITRTDSGFGPGGFFLFDGNAINPNTPPDTTTGTAGAACEGESGECAQFPVN